MRWPYSTPRIQLTGWFMDMEVSSHLPATHFGVSNMSKNVVSTNLAHRYRKVPVLGFRAPVQYDALLTWRSAFRECAKLASNSARRSEEATLRLAAWCSIANAERYSKWCLQGARDGHDYGEMNIGSQKSWVWSTITSDCKTDLSSSIAAIRLTRKKATGEDDRHKPSS
jgi:hypothetical protein